MSLEEEEIALAMMLSLEDEKKSQRSRDDEAFARRLANEHEDSDASLALALELQLNEEMPTEKTFNKDRGGLNNANNIQNNSGMLQRLLNTFGGNGEQRLEDKTCRICGNGNKHRSVIRAAGGVYCQHCFRCSNCNCLLESKFFQNNAKTPDAVYCEICIKDLFSIRCTICSAHISGRYLRHGYFEDELYCLSHEQLDARRKCFTCSRLEPLPDVGKGLFVDLPDSRACCLECLSSAVMTSEEATALYKEAVKYMASLGLETVPGMLDVPVLAVDVQSLNAQAAQGSTTHHGSVIDYRQGGSGSVVRGLTLSRSFEVAHFGTGDMSFSFEHGFQISQPRVMRIDTRREVTAVLVLYGLPRDLMSSILAHEAMHVWLKLQKCFPMDIEPATEEGICQVISRRFLLHCNNCSSRCIRSDDKSQSVTRGTQFKSFGNPVRTGGFDFISRPKATQSKIALKAEAQPKAIVEDPNEVLEAKLRRYFVHCIERDQSRIYGDGYREAERVISEIGLHTTLDHVKDTKRLPNI